MSLKRGKFLSLGGFSLISFSLGGFIKNGSNHLVRSITTLERPIFASELGSQTSTNNKLNTTDLLLRFISVADRGTGEDGQYSIAQWMVNYRRENPYDLIILAGDNIYTNAEIKKNNSVFERP